MKTHYPYFFIKFSKDNLSPLEPIYTNSWKKNFLKNCPLKGTSSGGARTMVHGPWTMINFDFSTPYTKMVYQLFSTKKYIFPSVNRNIKWTESVATIYSCWPSWECSNYSNSNILNTKLYFIYKIKLQSIFNSFSIFFVQST